MTSPTVRADDDLPLTVPALLAARAADRGSAPLAVCDDERLTYAEADERSAALARGLLASGAGVGTHVALLFPNTPDLVVGWLAAARIGAVAVPLSTFSTAAELTGLLRGADVALLLATRSHRSHDYEERLAAAVPTLDLAGDGPVLDPTVPTLRGVHLVGASDAVHPARTVDGLVAAGRSVGADVLAAAERAVTPADRMAIIHTSGSTSAPKGVVHAHGPLIRHLDNLNQLRRYDEHEVLFATSPWFWIGGFAYALLGTLVAGATLVTSSSADAGAVLDLLERERPTMVNGFAAAVAHLAEHPTFADRDLSSIRRGNLWPLLPDDVRPADPALRHGMLGLTEAGSVCLASPDESDLPEHQRGSFGRPVPGFEAEVVDPDSGVPVAPGEVGELRLRGPFLMEGYHGRERSEAFDPDGWFATGDLFHVDGDGLFYFHGRHGLMIKTAGANVSPLEVEGVLADVAGLRSHVLGLDDEARGQVVAAAVVSDEPVDVDDLRRTLREQLSAYKVPTVVVVLREDEVPMMSSGKVDLRALREVLDAR